MNSPAQQLYYVFRIACAMCFIGHGAFGIITKQIWCNYFAVFGIGEALAYQLMPVVGIMDISLGLVLLFYPWRFAAAWLVFWGLFTALLRPLSGEPFAEFIERAGNYGAPLILLMIAGAHDLRTKWFQKLEAPGKLNREQWRVIIITIQVVGLLLIAGHGWLNLIQKPALLKQYASLGFGSPERIAQFVGMFEMIGAFSLLLWPVRQFVLALFVWKMISEIPYPTYAFFEWVERGGSYGTLLALWIALRNKELSSLVFSIAPRALTRSTKQNELTPQP